MRLKILFFSHKFYPDIGGIESNSEILATYFLRAGHEICLVTWSVDKTKKIFPFKIIRNPNNKQLFAAHSWADIIFENNPCLQMAWPNLFFKKPSVIALNTWLTRGDGTIGIQDKIKLYFLKKANCVIAVSNAVRIHCWPAAIVIANPYNEKLFKIIPGINRINHFVFLGRLVSDKGANLAIEAMKHFENARLTIIGDGPELINLNKLVEELQLTDRIDFTGSLSGNKLVECLNKHQYILVPSIWEEPFGNIVLEGMACGCLPIVSKSGGLPDAVGKAGVTFIKGNVRDLVESINKIVTNKIYELQLRNNASDHLSAHQSQIIAYKYLAIIKCAAVTKKS